MASEQMNEKTLPIIKLIITVDLLLQKHNLSFFLNLHEAVLLVFFYFNYIYILRMENPFNAVDYLQTINLYILVILIYFLRGQEIPPK